MKYLKKFELTSEYNSFVDSNEFIMPNVSYVKNDDKVYYHSLVVRNNVITYLANSKLPETTDTGSAFGLHVNAFNSPMVSHEFADGIGTITFEEDVTKIGFQAFRNCTGLASIVIPDSVTSISSYAFGNCSGLTSIVIPDSVTEIDTQTFWYCTGLTGVTIGSGVTSIGYEAFEGCSGLTSIVIPDSVTEIDYYAFHFCSNLTDVTIGSGVTEIDYFAFEGCSELTEIKYNGYTYQWRNINLHPDWRLQSAIERVICLDGVIDLTIPTVGYIEDSTSDINLTVGESQTLTFFIYDTSSSSITTAMYGESDNVAGGNYYYYQYNGDAINVTDYGFDGQEYSAEIYAKKQGTYYLDIYAGPGTTGDEMQSIQITIS